MKRIKKISVVILIYNNFKFIDEALSSLVKQDLNDINYEIIISDDASTNLDVKYINNAISEYNLKDKTTLIINKENLGTVKSFNNAIEASNGDIIIPLAVDDKFYDSNVISDIVKFFESNMNCLIATGLQIPFSGSLEYNSIINKKNYNLFEKPNKLLKHIILNRNIMSGASTYYHKDIFTKYGKFDESFRLLEDYPFYLKILSKGEKIFLMKKNTIKYRLGGISTSKKIHPALDEDLRNARRYSLSLIKINPLKKRKIIYTKILTNKEQEYNKFKFLEQYIYKKIKEIIRK